LIVPATIHDTKMSQGQDKSDTVHERKDHQQNPAERIKENDRIGAEQLTDFRMSFQDGITTS
jgi:hypothetical protein